MGFFDFLFRSRIHAHLLFVILGALTDCLVYDAPLLAVSGRASPELVSRSYDFYARSLNSPFAHVVLPLCAAVSLVITLLQWLVWFGLPSLLSLVLMMVCGCCYGLANTSTEAELASLQWVPQHEVRIRELVYTLARSNMLLIATVVAAIILIHADLAGLSWGLAADSESKSNKPEKRGGFLASIASTRVHICGMFFLAGLLGTDSVVDFPLLQNPSSLHHVKTAHGFYCIMFVSFVPRFVAPVVVAVVLCGLLAQALSRRSIIMGAVVVGAMIGASYFAIAVAPLDQLLPLTDPHDPAQAPHAHNLTLRVAQGHAGLLASVLCLSLLCYLDFEIFSWSSARTGDGASLPSVLPLEKLHSE